MVCPHRNNGRTRWRKFHGGVLLSAFATRRARQVPLEDMTIPGPHSFGVSLAATALMVVGLVAPEGVRTVGRRVGLASTATVESRVATLGPTARQALAPYFRAAGVKYPGRAVILVGLKEERRLDVYAVDDDGRRRFIRGYPVTAASGGPGPKLQQGDLQVPEGLYGIESLNPNSRYHLSLRVSYPNAFDRAQGKLDGRAALGGDIMIHGGRASIGCLAIGDAAIEELFVLAADVGRDAMRVILAPRDLRRPTKLIVPPQAPTWTLSLWTTLRIALAGLPTPAGP